MSALALPEIKNPNYCNKDAAHQFLLQIGYRRASLILHNLVIPRELIIAIAKRLVDFVDGRIDTAGAYDIYVLADFVELGLLMLECQ